MIENFFLILLIICVLLVIFSKLSSNSIIWFYSAGFFMAILFWIKRMYYLSVFQFVSAVSFTIVFYSIHSGVENEEI